MLFCGNLKFQKRKKQGAPWLGLLTKKALDRYDFFCVIPCHSVPRKELTPGAHPYSGVIHSLIPQCEEGCTCRNASSSRVVLVSARYRISSTLTSGSKSKESSGSGS